MEFEQRKYAEVLNAFHEKVGVVFDGQVSEKLAKKITMIM